MAIQFESASFQNQPVKTRTDNSGGVLLFTGVALTMFASLVIFLALNLVTRSSNKAADPVA